MLIFSLIILVKFNMSKQSILFKLIFLFHTNISETMSSLHCKCKWFTHTFLFDISTTQKKSSEEIIFIDSHNLSWFFLCGWGVCILRCWTEKTLFKFKIDCNLKRKKTIYQITQRIGHGFQIMSERITFVQIWTFQFINNFMCVIWKTHHIPQVIWELFFSFIPKSFSFVEMSNKILLDLDGSKIAVVV